MVTIRETVNIPALFKKLNAWIDNFEEEFVKWSPLHLECELFDKSIKKGDRVRFNEIVMGIDYDVTGTIIESARDKDHFTMLRSAVTRLPRRSAKRWPLTSGSAASVGGSLSGSSPNWKSCPRWFRNSTKRSGAAWWIM